MRAITSASAAGPGHGWAIPLSGMRDAALRLDVAAHNIANLNTEGFVPSRVVSAEVPGGGVQSRVERLPAPAGLGLEASGTDLPAEIAHAVQAEVAFRANALVLRMQARTTRALLDLLA